MADACDDEEWTGVEDMEDPTSGQVRGPDEFAQEFEDPWEEHLKLDRARRRLFTVCEDDEEMNAEDRPPTPWDDGSDSPPASPQAPTTAEKVLLLRQVLSRAIATGSFYLYRQTRVRLTEIMPAVEWAALVTSLLRSEAEAFASKNE